MVLANGAELRVGVSVEDKHAVGSGPALLVGSKDGQIGLVRRVDVIVGAGFAAVDDQCQRFLGYEMRKEGEARNWKSV